MNFELVTELIYDSNDDSLKGVVSQTSQSPAGTEWAEIDAYLDKWYTLSSPSPAYYPETDILGEPS